VNVNWFWYLVFYFSCLSSNRETRPFLGNHVKAGMDVSHGSMTTMIFYFHTHGFLYSKLKFK
jgi:hypothetical protein